MDDRMMMNGKMDGQTDKINTGTQNSQPRRMNG